MEIQGSDQPVVVRTNVIEVTKTARYLTYLEGDIPSEIIIVLHGYGHDVSKFMEEIIPCVSPGQMIVAPEGLSRFYWQGMGGKVVASWMTNTERLSEIKDHKDYLEKLLTHLFDQMGKVPFTVLGFSQGVSTACRWLASSAHAPQQLILWAGNLPEEEYLVNLLPRVSGKLHVVWGKNDPYLTELILAENHRKLDNLKCRWMDHNFEGGHKLDTKLLRSLFQSQSNYKCPH